jgi:hypothetical protein
MLRHKHSHFVNCVGYPIAPYDETDPAEIRCPNPKCETGEVFTEKFSGIYREKGFRLWCPVCDGSMTIRGDDGTSRMWDAIEWADRRGLNIEVEEWL